VAAKRIQPGGAILAISGFTIFTLFAICLTSGVLYSEALVFADLCPLISVDLAF
jgi:hypothetical protein